MKPSIETRDMDRSDEYFVGTCTHTNESDEMDAAASRRLTWLRSMHEKGLRVKVAALGGQLTGFINGDEIGWGYEAPRDGLREAIQRARDA